jgi:hypothetical protein
MSKYPNSGTLARNDRREKDTHPEFTGKAEVDGVMYWISAWVKDGNGGKFFSLSFKKQDGQEKKRPMTDDHPGDPDVPF